MRFEVSVLEERSLASSESPRVRVEVLVAIVEKDIARPGVRVEVNEVVEADTQAVVVQVDVSFARIPLGNVDGDFIV